MMSKLTLLVGGMFTQAYSYPEGAAFVTMQQSCDVRAVISSCFFKLIQADSKWPLLTSTDSSSSNKPSVRTPLLCSSFAAVTPTELTPKIAV